MKLLEYPKKAIKGQKGIKLVECSKKAKGEAETA